MQWTIGRHKPTVGGLERDGTGPGLVGQRRDVRQLVGVVAKDADNGEEPPNTRHEPPFQGEAKNAPEQASLSCRTLPLPPISAAAPAPSTRFSPH